MTPSIVWEILDSEVKPDSEIRIANGVKALKLIMGEITQKWLDADPASTKSLIQKAIESAIDVFSGELDPGFYGEVSNWVIDSELLKWEPIPGTTIDFKTEFLEGNCIDPNSAECLGAFRDAVDTLRICELAYRCIACVVQDKALHRAQEYFTKRNKQWDIYFNGIPQWPWELVWVNGPLYGRATRDEMGSIPPPTYQIVCFHPDLTLEYVPEAEDGQQFEPALMIEWLGIDFWTWKGSKQSGPLFGYPLGAGFVSTLSDRADLSDVSWGGILHINHIFNVGVNFREGEPGYFVSANLNKAVHESQEPT